MKNKIAILFTATLMVSIVFANISQLLPAFAVSMPSPSWRSKTVLPAARGQASVITGEDGLIYAMGGFAGGAVFSTVVAYDPMTETWTAKAAMPTATRGAAVAKVEDEIIYVIGGFSGGYVNAVQAYNATSNTWATKTAIPTAAWMAGAATGNDGKIYVIGGESPGAFYSNATQVYDPESDTWSEGADMPTARSLLGVVKGADGLIYAMGGNNGTGALSVVEAYNPSTNTWATKASMPAPKVEFGVTLGPDEKIYVIGGGTDGGNNSPPFFDTVEIYDPKTNTWSTPSWTESYLPTARKELGATTGANGKIYAIGGANGAYLTTNEEAAIILPENVAPTAYIDSITPNPATRGQSVSFTGHGSDPDGSVAAYKWRSSLNGTIGAAASFSVSTLAVGTHTIYFSVRDNAGTWSTETMTILTVNRPASEDPTYQQLVTTTNTLNGRIDDLEEQNTALQNNVGTLQNTVDDLTAQNNLLADQADALTASLNSTTMMLLGVGIVTIVLAIVIIAMLFMRKPKAAA